MNSPIYRQHIMDNICSWKAAEQYDYNLAKLCSLYNVFPFKSIVYGSWCSGSHLLHLSALERIVHALKYSVRYISGQICNETDVKGLDLQLFFSSSLPQAGTLQLQLSKYRPITREDFAAWGDGRWWSLLSPA